MEGGTVEVMQRCESISLNLIHQMGSKRRLSGRRVEADSLADPRRQTPIDRCSGIDRSIDRSFVCGHNVRSTGLNPPIAAARELHESCNFTLVVRIQLISICKGLRKLLAARGCH